MPARVPAARPDYLGYPSALAMAAGSPWRRRAGLAIKKVGNQLIAALGGRPRPSDLGAHRRLLARPAAARPRWDRRSLDAAVDQARDNRSPRGVRGIPRRSSIPSRWSRCATRPSTPTTTAGSCPRRPRPLARRLGRGVRRGACRGDQRLHARTHDGRVYLLGPTARIALASDQLHPLAAEALARPGSPTRSGQHPPFDRRPRDRASSTPAPRPATSSTGSPAARAARRVHAATGVAAWSTEAPRGILHHRYEVDEREPGDPCPDRPADEPEPGCHRGGPRGAFAPSVLDLPHAEATRRLEMLIRAYDPCISCATHFLDLSIVDAETAEEAIR